MLRDILYIARKDVYFMLKARETIMWIFFMPIIFFYFIGTVTGGFGPSSSALPKIAVQAGDNPGFLLEQLRLRLEDGGFDVVTPDDEADFMRYYRRLRVPDNFSDQVLAGQKTDLEFYYGSEDQAGDYDNIKVQRAVYTVLADVVALSESGDAPNPAALAVLNAMPRAVQLEVKAAGARKQIPTGFQQSIPGIMVMFTLMVMTTSGAVLILIERREGLLRRLAYAPMSRLSIVLGKLGGKFAIGMIQIAFAMLAGTLLPMFKMDWGPNIAMVVVVMMFYAALMASIGIVLGSLARSEGQVIGIGVLASNILAALGGCWWPIEITPDFMQKLQLFIPTGWAMDSLHKLVSFGADPSTVIPHVVVMALATAVMVRVGVRVFRFQ